MLQLPEPHPRQYELINAFELRKGVRFVVGACGTKFGKTYGCTIRLVKEAWDNKNSLNWWVAPTFAQSKMAYSMVKRLLPKDTFLESKTDLRITLLEPDGSEHSVIEFKSGDNPDSLRGFRVNFFVLDEAARMPYDSFVSIMTTVTQTRGRGIIISTPKGRGWFYEVYGRGEKENLMEGEIDQWPEWFSIRMPTWMNPTVDEESLREAKRNLPEDVWRQEFAAQFLLESEGVFRNIRGCVGGTLQPPQPGHRYVIGVDLGRLRDFTVLTVIDTAIQPYQVVAFDRFNQISWEIQAYRIKLLADQYNRATVIVDATGLGDPIVEALQGIGVRVDPHKSGGNAAKQQLIDKLRVNIENKVIRIPNDDRTRIIFKELEAYEYKFTETGVVRFSAPPGQHDDCVTSLALANLGADQAPWIYKYRNIRGI